MRFNTNLDSQRLAPEKEFWKTPVGEMLAVNNLCCFVFVKDSKFSTVTVKEENWQALVSVMFTVNLHELRAVTKPRKVM